MKTKIVCWLVALSTCSLGTVGATDVSLASAPPVVVRTVPVAGAMDVDPALTEIKVTYSKMMQDGSWSWSTWGEENFPEMIGQPKYLADGRTCVLTVKLQPGKFYATWLNSDKFRNFKDADGRPAVPYLLTFHTGAPRAVGAEAVGDGEELAREGWKLWQARKLDESVAKFRAAVKAAPENAGAWNGLGWACFNSGKHDEAETAFQVVIELQPEHPAALNGLGQLALVRNKLDAAEKYFLAAGPQAPAAWYGLARLYLLQERYDQAETWARKVVDSGQADDFARQMLQAAQDKRVSDALRKQLGGQAPVAPANSSAETDWSPKLNDEQRALLAWTGRQFRNFFDTRSFDGWPAEERQNLEKRLIDALNGPHSREYYQAIGSLAALRSTNALPKLREIAFDRAEKDNRDRWMAIRAIGIIGDKSAVPELARLVYHGNTNTRWWAQLALVRLTGQNFADDWSAWGEWWNKQGGQPAYNPEIVRWWSGQADSANLKESLAEKDREFLSRIQSQGEATSAPREQSGAKSREEYLKAQREQAKAGNYWAKFKVWEALAKGTHGVSRDSAEADKWLSELVAGVYLAKFEPVNGFNPKTPGEMLEDFSAKGKLFSGKESLGGASFFRTTKQGEKLIGAFLTSVPDEFKSAIERNPNLKLISIEKLTPEMFVKHEASPQESL